MINKISTSLLAFVLMILTSATFGQQSQTDEAKQESIKRAAREIMNKAQTCALITLDEKGFPAARAMDAFPPEDDFSVWMGTNPKSRKVDQIRKNHQVTLYYLAQESSGYVLLKGSAELITDPAQKVKRWKTGWEMFYSDKDNGYMLIKFSPVSMEVVSYPHQIMGDTLTWAPPVIEFEK